MRGMGKFDFHEFGKRSRRILDGNFSYRKIVILIIIFGAVLLYFGPTVFRWVSLDHSEHSKDFEDRCMNEKLAKFYPDLFKYDASVIDKRNLDSNKDYLPYIGNGYFGVSVTDSNVLYIKYGRTLSLPIQWSPLVNVLLPEKSQYRESIVTHFTDGIVHKHQCFKEHYHVEYQYYAHRVFENILVQTVKITNPSKSTVIVPFSTKQSEFWRESNTELEMLPIDDTFHEYSLTFGYVKLPDSEKVIAISIIHKTVPKEITVMAQDFVNLEFLASVSYSEPITKEQYRLEKESMTTNNMNTLKKALSMMGKHSMRENHVNSWQSYWSTGFAISDSKAKGAINGDKINSTLYYILSQASNGPIGIEKSLNKNVGCYHGHHHTLDAQRLWEDTSTIEGVNDVVKAWFMTLGKQGCHNLMSGNPLAVQQAVVLSLGRLRFSKHHLQFDIDPQYLHRDYFFRRINYGNTTHLNISVTVNEQNRAILSVALDRSDTVYYGCDAGCLDAPVPLSQSYTNFPVKLTKPLTAILFITADYQHMQELRSVLHIHELNEAPAHDQQVMALHKHGHQLGGLPTFFWVIICFLIIVFHLFLCKLIINEFCDHQDRQKVRYSKL